MDIAYAKALGLKIKLLAASKRTESGTWAMVAPRLVDKSNMLYHVEGVLNAVYVHGNALGDCILYGSGAGSLPTASAVAGDVISAARNHGRPLPSDWSDEVLELLPIDEVRNTFFVRFSGSEEEAEAAFGTIDAIRIPEAEGEFGFFTAELSEKEFREMAEKSGKVIKAIRRA